MDAGLRLIDVLIVIADYLSWWSYDLLEVKMRLIEFSVHVLHYNPIQWF